MASIRKNKIKYHYTLYPKEQGKVKNFKRKSDLMNFIKSNAFEYLNCLVIVHYKGFFQSGDLRRFVVFINLKKYKNHNKIDFVLKPCNFRGFKKTKPIKLKKENKSFWAFYDKMFNKMIQIANSEHLSDDLLTQLLRLMSKRYGDLSNVNDEYSSYCLGVYDDINDFDRWFYWSDRLGEERAKAIYDLIKKSRPHLFN